MSNAQKVVVGQAAPPINKGETGYADWGIISIHALREYLDPPYRRLMEILFEMPLITSILGLRPSALPDFLPFADENRSSKWASEERFLL